MAGSTPPRTSARPRTPTRPIRTGSCPTGSRWIRRSSASNGKWTRSRPITSTVGFRSTLLFGIDYRYMTAGGWFSDQLLENNRLYGVDPTEQYVDVYIPGIAQGLIVRVGRWIACPDIETQFAPDNYMGTHSLLVHLRHLHADRHHGDGHARQAVDGASAHPIRHRHGPVVSGRHRRRHVRRPLGVVRQQRLGVHGLERHQQRAGSAIS